MTSEGPTRRTRTGRAFVALGVMLGLGAVGLGGYAAWELWGTNAHEADAQDALREAYDATEPESDTDADSHDATAADETGSDDAVELTPEVPLGPGGSDLENLQARFPSSSPAMALLEAPAIMLDKFVMRDVTVAALRDGPGHYQGTVRPGFAGNSAIAGHRTTYGSPFGRVDELQPGDTIFVTSADGRFTYEVMDPIEAYAGFEDEIREFGDGHVIVGPEDTWIVRDFGDARLTLTSCHPENTSRHRIVVTAQLVSEAAPTPDLFGGTDPEALVELVSEDFGVLED